MNVVRHHTPGQQQVPVSIEMPERQRSNRSDGIVFQPASPRTAVEVLVHFPGEYVS
jgi:hypothetical protein